MINLKAIEEAVFEDVKAILAQKPGAARPCHVIAKERYPGETVEALLSQMAYVALVQAVAPEVIKMILAKRAQAKAKADPVSEAAKEADKADAAADKALEATKLTEDVIARAKAKAKKKAA
jgi:hypothetical protein